MNYKWNILGKAENIKEVLLNIIKWKNISKEEVRDFIDFKMKPHDPYLLTNMDHAINRINKAIKNEESIMIIGDYDVDGITGVSVLYIGLKSIYRNVHWIIPDRFKDGYGMNNRLIDVAKEKNCSLIITVDNGISSHKQVEYANSLNIDVIVTDHHEFTHDKLPTPITINPNIDDSYPFKSICGCMVAFKLLLALMPDLENKDNDLYKELVSLVTLATISDMMDLVDENRYYVKKGLYYLSNTNNIGLNSLLSKMNLYGKDISSDDIGYSIGPCINAAGRLDSPDIAAKLLLCDDPIEADRLADKLINLNNKRKDMQKEILDNLHVDDNDDFIVIYIENNKEKVSGILGIIAGQLSDKYKKPCFALSGDKHKTISGSGRSIYSYNINDIIQSNLDILSGGGHAEACGVKLKYKDLELFKDKCNNHFRKWLSNTNADSLIPTLEATNEIELDLINLRLINNIKKLSPYGQGNEEPMFVTKNLNVKEYRIVGRNSNVIQMTLSNEKCSIKSIGFNNIKEKYERLSHPNKIDVLYTIELNEWPEGVFNPQLVIKDIKLSTF